MGKCKNCDAEVDDKYEFCFKCSKELKDKGSDDLVKVLKEIALNTKHINWNLGIMSNILRKKPEVVKQIEEDMNNENKP